jgi:hypothetical protein
MPCTNAMLFDLSNKMLHNLSNETTPKKIIFKSKSRTYIMIKVPSKRPERVIFS